MDEGVGQEGKDAKRRGEKERDFLRVLDGDGFGEEFAEDDGNVGDGSDACDQADEVCPGLGNAPGGEDGVYIAFECLASVEAFYHAD